MNLEDKIYFMSDSRINAIIIEKTVLESRYNPNEFVSVVQRN